MWRASLRAEGNVGKVTAGGMTGSLLFAGVNDTSALPDDPSDFDALSPAAIGSLTIRGIPGSTDAHFFVGSVVAASRINSVTLRDVGTVGGTAYVPLGLAADTEIGSLKIYTGGSVTTSRRSITASLPDVDDFRVRVV